MQNSLDDDHIPLLDDLIVPGKAIKDSQAHAEQPEANDDSHALTTHGTKPKSPESHELTAHGTKQKSSESHAPKTAFEAAIEAMVTEILKRHLESAREEIIRAVLGEVRARLAGRSKSKQPAEPTKK